MTEVRLVGLVSTYLEGQLARGAVRSLLSAVDVVYVCEGPAGKPLEVDVPATDLGKLVDHVDYRTGRWRTDARKRTAMLECAQREHPGDGPLWGIWLDGDEVLFNGEYLRDWLQVLAWKEELDGCDPYLGRPIRLVELDGSLGWARQKLMRLDLIRRYEVSAASFINQHGISQGAGTVRDSYADWRNPREYYFKNDQIVMPPPIPGEPHILHRSALRHPLRAGLRLHHQEADEYASRVPGAT